MSPPEDFRGLVGIIVDLIRAAIPLVISLAVMVFFWGVVKFIFNLGGDEKALREGKKLMLWGLIALFILISIWGILRFMYSEVGFSDPFGLPLLPPER